MKRGKSLCPEHSRLTLSQRYSDKLTDLCGSWKFIISVFVLIFLWGIFNVIVFVEHWDPYPYIFLNFILSCMAAIQGPIILMSQNRQQQRDRAKAERDYIVNRKAEREVEHIQKELDSIKIILREMKRK
jgi:uncharacterized membrane protein